MIESVLERITDNLPAKEIKDGDTPYLERYYLGTVLGVRFYLHQFVASDPDRGRHSHPWPWAVSALLTGPYLEERDRRTYVRRWFNFLTGNTFHRVVLLPAPWGGVQPVWTLFAHRAKRTKSWGFLRPAPCGGGMLYVPHRPSPEDAWWKTAPTGREMRAARA